MPDTDGPDVTACERCSKLVECRSQIVNGVGDEDADLLFVGEAPGEQEDESGEPFVGRSGSVLDEYLSRHGINRDDVRITNCVRCRPPENRDPSAEEVEHCREFLNAEIDLVDPTVIVALGKVPAEELLGESVPVTKMAGTVVEEPIANTLREIVVSVHPAATLYDSSQEDAFESAIETAVERSGTEGSQSTLGDF